jgi:hypothetical protein
MVNFPGRNSRRRRVLNEEVLSASASHLAVRSVARDDEASDAPRYSDAAGVENHPQVTDFVPRRYPTIALLVLAGIATSSVLGLLDYFRASIAARLGASNVGALDSSAGGSVSAWVQSIVLLAGSGLCQLIYSIRRHRIDDIRGRYRIWQAAMVACLLLSANSVAGVHKTVADVLGNLTGWTALPGGAIWWLVLGGVPVVWIIVRTLLDVRECRLSTALVVSAVLLYVTSVLSFLGALPASDARVAVIVTNAALLIGHWLVFAAAVAQARFVVLDAQGLITAGVRVVRERKAQAKLASMEDGTQQASPITAKRSIAENVVKRHSTRPAPTGNRAETAQWIDGSSPERDPYDDGGDGDDGGPDDGHKLGKSQRKRMRKLKAQSRAA